MMKMKIGKKEQQIYLNPENKLKVPECFWKVVYHGSSKTAIVIVTSNNPYQLKAKTLCRDICEKSNWANREFYNVKKGYTYCCTYESFKKVVQFVPELEVQGILQMPSKLVLNIIYLWVDRYCRRSLKFNKGRLHTQKP